MSFLHDPMAVPARLVRSGDHHDRGRSRRTRAAGKRLPRRGLAEGCERRLLPEVNGGRPQGQTITPADQAHYLRAAAWMRSHGFAEFPNPTFPNNRFTINIPSSIDTNSSRYTSAAATCVKLIPAGLPYSSSGTP
jgi:hypothetical protein